MSPTLLYSITYFCVALLVAAVAWRAYSYVSKPLHLRWEIYPVAHDAKRASYGGSYLEEVDWWTKPIEKSLLGELKAMVPEILFLSSVYKNNRKLWYRSFPFHFGLYMLCVLAGLLVFGALLQLIGVEVGAEGGLGALVYYGTVLVGPVGIVLCLAGSVALLHARLTDEDLKDYTAPAHLFNLGFFILALSVAFLAFVVRDHEFVHARNYVANLIGFNVVAVPSRLVALEILLFSLLAAYVPLTHMSHFFMKYFMWHDIRWGDEPNVNDVNGARIEKALMAPVAWRAEHVRADGKKNWVDVATESFVKESQDGRK